MGSQRLVFPGLSPRSSPGKTLMEGGPRLATATFARGCFWCIEAAFDKAQGVVTTTPGHTLAGMWHVPPTNRDPQEPGIRPLGSRAGASLRIRPGRGLVNSGSASHREAFAQGARNPTTANPEPPRLGPARPAFGAPLRRTSPQP
jgi:hypothetical protein